MPTYDIRCERSGLKFDRFIKLENFSEPIFCSCGSPAKRLISRPLISVDRTGYNCPITGKWIGSKREHEENLKRHDCRVLESGEKEASAKARQKADEELDRKIEDTVEKEIDRMPSEKKEKLAAELERGGLTVEVVRS